MAGTPDSTAVSVTGTFLDDGYPAVATVKKERLSPEERGISSSSPATHAGKAAMNSPHENSRPSWSQSRPSSLCDGLIEVPRGYDYIALPFLEKVLKEENIDKLEICARQAAKVLEHGEPPLFNAGDPERADDFKKKMNDLTRRALDDQAVIAVVGDSGVGKSSLLNAVLGFDNLIPTSGMEACTAVATEIVYNRSDDPHRRFGATIKYISLEKWTSDIQAIVEDMKDENGALSSEYSNKESEAGVAYAKVRAVYPQLTRTKEMVEQLDPKQLLSHPEVTKVLGKTDDYWDSDQDTFRSTLEGYLASIERPARLHGKKIPMAKWPLIESVRIHVKSEALSTGTVLMDLVS